MYGLYIICFVLLSSGIMAVLGVRLRDFLNILLDAGKQPMTLADEIHVLVGTPAKGFFAQGYGIKQISRDTGRAERYETISRWHFRSAAGNCKKSLDEELETALSMITTSYLRTEDILRSVRENLPYIKEPIKASFEAFVYESELPYTSTASAMNALKLRIPNQVFHEWASILLQCQSDRTMKHVLPTVVRKFSDVRAARSELEARLRGPRREALDRALWMTASVPVMYFLNRNWFYHLIYTSQGRLALAVCAALVLLAVMELLKLSKPIEYGGGTI